MKKLFGVGALALACAAVPAFADKLPPVFDGLVGAGAKVVKSFPVGDGLTGWVVRHPGGEHMVVYTTAGGQYMLAGALFDKTGTNLTQAHVEAQVPTPDYSGLMPDLKRATAITTGRLSGANGTVYVFFDLNCTYCAQTYKAMKAADSKGVQVRWVPVAILGPTSSTKAETLMSASDPRAALDAAETNWPNGIEAASKVSEKTTAMLAANLELMQKFNLKGTPGIVYEQAGKVKTVGGAPKPDQLERIFEGSKH